jgi:hypothetical protein
MFDISKLAAKDTFVLELSGPNDEPLKSEDGKALSINIYGPGSKPYARAQAVRTQRMVDRMGRKGKTKISPEEQVQENAEFLAACTVSFNNFDYKGGADFAAAYADASLGWMAEQVAAAIGDWKNFSAGSATS